MDFSPLHKRGIYLLLLQKRKESNMKIGKLGSIHLEKGLYLYVGSAKGGFYKRVKRYLKKKRNKKWHIDYLLDDCELLAIILIPLESLSEEEVVKRLEKISKPYVHGFGSSDSKAPSHLLKLLFT